MNTKTTSIFFNLSLLIVCIIAATITSTAQNAADITVEGFNPSININNFSGVVGEGANLNFKWNGDTRYTIQNPGGTQLLSFNTPIGNNRVSWDEFGHQVIGVVATSSTETYTLTLAGPTGDGLNSLANVASTGTGHASLRINDKANRTSRIQFTNESTNSWHQLQSSTDLGLLWLAYYDEDQTPNAIDRDFTFNSKDVRFGVGSANPEFTLHVVHGPTNTNPSNPLTNMWDSNQGVKLSNTDGQEWVIHVKGDEFTDGTAGDLTFLSVPFSVGNGHVRSSIDYFTGAYNMISDRRLKENIEYLDKGGSLEKILKLKPAIYNMKGQNPADKSYGLIAQETQKIIPEIVTSMSSSVSNNTIGLSYTELIPIMIAANQEQQDLINKLLEENKLLKSEMSSFRAELKAVNKALENNSLVSNK